MESQVKVIAVGVALANGVPHRSLGIIADELDAVGKQQRLHSIGQQVHEVFLAARPGDIGVIFLGGRTQINFRHGHSPFLVILCQNTGSAHW